MSDEPKTPPTSSEHHEQRPPMLRLALYNGKPRVEQIGKRLTIIGQAYARLKEDFYTIKQLAAGLCVQADCVGARTALIRYHNEQHVVRLSDCEIYDNELVVKTWPLAIVEADQ